jgi:cell division septation protein DedD
MPRTEDGEFELVLGNKQLLSVFFIIVILLGVFFTMGYIVGRNSAPVSASTDRNGAPVPAVARADSMPRTPAATPVTETAASAPAAGAPEVQTSVEPASQPAAKVQESAKPAEKPLEIPPVGGAKLVNPEPGQMFVQVSSMLAQAEADIMTDVLGKKGFRSVIAPGPNEGKYRVLVGPVRDASDASRVKSELEQAGFKGAFVKKY